MPLWYVIRLDVLKQKLENYPVDHVRRSGI